MLLTGANWQNHLPIRPQIFFDFFPAKIFQSHPISPGELKEYPTAESSKYSRLRALIGPSPG
jgi:hypothetical protein